MDHGASLDLAHDVLLERAQLQQELAIRDRELTALKDRLAESQHVKKKEIVEIKTELEFERKKAAELEEKHKQLIREREDATGYKNMCSDLTEQLSLKQSEVQELRRNNFQLKKRITELESDIEIMSPAMVRSRSKNNLNQDQALKQLAEEVSNLKIEKAKIMEGAVNAIMEKDNVICELEETIRELRESCELSSGNEFLELKEKYNELEERLEKENREHEESLYYKNNEIGELKERLETAKARSEQRASRLENDISEYERYIEQLKEEKTHEDNLAENYDALQEKNRKSQKFIQELEINLNDFRITSQEELKKLETEVVVLKNKIEVLKVYEANFNSLEKETEKQKKIRDKEVHDLNQTIEHLTQSKSEAINKNMELEAEKKRLLENLDDYKRQCNDALAEKEKFAERYSELKENFGLRLQEQKEMMLVGDKFSFKSETTIEAPNATQSTHPTSEEEPEFTIKRDTLEEEMNKTELINSRRREQQEDVHLTDNLKKQIAQLGDRIAELEEELGKKMAQIQSQREKMLKISQQFANNQKEQGLQVEIEQLKSHLLKIENNLLIVKLKSAEDENFWRERQVADRREFAEKQNQHIKQKTELYEKLEKLRRSKGQAKSDYYQSSLK